jgi:protein-L-isoaspartate O-methyltransferase
MRAPSGFQLSGSAPEAYQLYGVAAIGTAKAQELIALVALQPGERVLDVACGTGVVARHAAQVVGTTGQIIGLEFFPDRAQGLREMARGLVPDGRPGLRVWRASASLRWPGRSESRRPAPNLHLRGR